MKNNYYFDWICFRYNITESFKHTNFKNLKHKLLGQLSLKGSSFFKVISPRCLENGRMVSMLEDNFQIPPLLPILSTS